MFLDVVLNFYKTLYTTVKRGTLVDHHVPAYNVALHVFKIWVELNDVMPNILFVQLPGEAKAKDLTRKGHETKGKFRYLGPESTANNFTGQFVFVLSSQDKFNYFSLKS